MTYKINLDWVKINHLAEYLSQRSFPSKVIFRNRDKHRHTTDQSH